MKRQARPTHKQGSNADPSELLSNLLARPHTAAVQSQPGLQLALFCGIDAQGFALVSIDGQAPQTAHSLLPLHSLAIGAQVAIAPLAASPNCLILGPLHSPAAPDAQSADALAVTLDGGKLLLQAQQEIELRCGEASILLTADGQIQLRGEYITSHASATQRIRGGSVNIN